MSAGAALGLLHGLPVAIKDMNDVAGLPTTYGSELFRDNVPEEDDALVAAVRAAGGLVLGKTNVPEWSAGANTRNRVHGVTANPYEPRPLRCRPPSGGFGGGPRGTRDGAPCQTGSDLAAACATPPPSRRDRAFAPPTGLVPASSGKCRLRPCPPTARWRARQEDAALLLEVLARPDRRDPWTRPVRGHAGRFARLRPADLVASAPFAVTEGPSVSRRRRGLRAGRRLPRSACNGWRNASSDRLEERAPRLAPAPTRHLSPILRRVARHSSAPIAERARSAFPDSVGPNVRGQRGGFGVSA